MKNTISLLAAIGGAIGLIGIVESVVTFSLFQTFISAGLVWGAIEFNRNAKESLQDDNN